MAYDKKYPNINDEILAFDKGQEDRTSAEFERLLRMFDFNIYWADTGDRGYMVFPNGFQVCWGRFVDMTGATREKPKINWFPRRFSEAPVVLITGDRRANDTVSAQFRLHSHLGDAKSEFYSSHSGSESAGVYMNYIAIGKKG